MSFIGFAFRAIHCIGFQIFVQNFSESFLKLSLNEDPKDSSLKSHGPLVREILRAFNEAAVDKYRKCLYKFARTGYRFLMKSQNMASVSRAEVLPTSDQANRGAFFVFVYVILTALHGVFVSSRVRAGWDTFALLFFSFLIAAGFFGAFALKNPRRFSSRLLANRREVVLINSASVVMWVCYYFGLKMMSPAMFAGIALGGGPVYLLIWRFIDEKIRPNPAQLWKASLFTTGAIALFASDVLNNPIDQLVLAIALSVACGFGVIWYTKLSRSLTDMGWPAAEAAAVRFWFLVIVAGSVWLATGNVASTKPPYRMIQDLAVTSILGQVVPLYALQKGIQLCPDRYKIALMMALTPLVTFALQFAFHITFSASSIVGLILVALSQISLPSRVQK